MEPEEQKYKLEKIDSQICELRKDLDKLARLTGNENKEQGQQIRNIQEEINNIHRFASKEEVEDINQKIEDFEQNMNELQWKVKNLRNIQQDKCSKYDQRSEKYIDSDRGSGEKMFKILGRTIRLSTKQNSYFYRVLMDRIILQDEKFKLEVQILESCMVNIGVVDRSRNSKEIASYDQLNRICYISDGQIWKQKTRRMIGHRLREGMKVFVHVQRKNRFIIFTLQDPDGTGIQFQERFPILAQKDRQWVPYFQLQGETSIKWRII